MSDLHDLLAQRLDARQNARERAALETIYVFVGRRVEGEIAEPPSARNTLVMKAGDPLPENVLYVAHFQAVLQAWYAARTKSTGINVRRWKTDAELIGSRT